MAGDPAGATAAKKPLKEEEDDDELDNVPLSVSRGKKASASKAKKEEDEDDDDFDNKPISYSRAKKGNEKPKSAMNSAKASKVKKEENESDEDFKLALPKKSGGAAASARTSKVKKIKDEELDDVKTTKKRASVKDEKTSTRKGDKEKVKKERKVYDLPGQKHDPPEERDPLRIFYESLYEQIPTSDMAATWLMEWGLLPFDVAKKVFENKQGQKLKSPVKTITAKRMPASPIKKTTPSSAKKTGSTANNAVKATSQKKRKASSDDDDDDFMAPISKTKRQKASS
ncbi:hypothetical protein QOZ80_3AG0241190 [Eleusine coracana subsp. coracana]|nr:hypothetical protein QOZ80_3AG0241190 [Eleusine coracana subsp. coracana]